MGNSVGQMTQFLPQLSGTKKGGGIKLQNKRHLELSNKLNGLEQAIKMINYKNDKRIGEVC